MANGLRGDLTLGEVRQYLRGLEPCWDRWQHYVDMPDGTSGYSAWEAAPVEDILWVIGELDPGITLEINDIYEEEVKHLAEVRGLAVSAAFDEYERAVEALRAGGGDMLLRDQGAALGAERVARTLVAWDTESAGVKRAKQRKVAALRSRTVYRKVLRQVKRHLKTT